MTTLERVRLPLLWKSDIPSLKVHSQVRKICGKLIRGIQKVTETGLFYYLFEAFLIYFPVVMILNISFGSIAFAKTTERIHLPDTIRLVGSRNTPNHSLLQLPYIDLFESYGIMPYS